MYLLSTGQCAQGWAPSFPSQLPHSPNDALDNLEEVRIERFVDMGTGVAH